MRHIRSDLRARYPYRVERTNDRDGHMVWAVVDPLDPTFDGLLRHCATRADALGALAQITTLQRRGEGSVGKG